jgi:Leucine-rich repeat (LRR) protein
MTNSVDFTNPVELTFYVPELFLAILKKTTSLDCRLVSKTWKTNYDGVLQEKWKELMENAPKGGVNIPLEMRNIEVAFPGASYLDRFKALGSVFAKLGVSIPGPSVPTNGGEFQELQKQMDGALQEVWSRRLASSIEGLGIPGLVLPASDANAEEIRAFLNDPANKDRLTRIMDIDLSRLQLTIVPPELDRFTGLVSLALNDNKLSRIPNFSNLQQLRTLNVSCNALSEVPYLASFPNLLTLNLSHNNLSEVPDFDLIPKLMTLNLNQNKLSKVPDFTHFVNLRRLTLDENQLSEIPDFAHLSHLELLEIKHNKLKKVPDFAHLPQLLTLDISHNELSEVPDFAHLPLLEALNASCCKLSKVPDFTKLSNLRGLHLESNLLSKVPGFIFLQNLVRLFLNKNQLRRTPNYDHLGHLEELDLTGNTFLPKRDQILHVFLEPRSLFSSITHKLGSLFADLTFSYKKQPRR